MRFNAKEVVRLFDEHLDQYDVAFEGVIIGGGALSLLGHTKRTTRDLDFLTSPIPPFVKRISEEFALKHGLSHNWVNTGPSTLIMDLPDDWEKNLVTIFEGKALTLRTLDRQSFIMTKLYAAVDRKADDLEDLQAMRPTPDEIQKAFEWICPLDANPDWENEVVKTTNKLRMMLDGENG